MEYDSKQGTFGPKSLFDLTESDKLGNLLKALYDARQEYQPLSKSGVNAYFKSNNKEHRYSTLKDVEDAVEGALQSHDLHLRHQIVAIQTEQGLGSILRTTLEHIPSGEFMSSIIAMESTGGPQATGSQITYYRRYNILSLLNLEADDEDDGNAAQGNKGDAAAPKSVKPSRSYELFDVKGEVARTYTDWGSFTKSLNIAKMGHSAPWRKSQIEMLEGVKKWASDEKKKTKVPSTISQLDQLEERAQKLIDEVGLQTS